MSGEGGAAERLDWEESIILALGGNLPSDGRSPVQTLEAALQALPAEGVTVRERSRPWRSPAWPDPADPPFVNQVARVETALAPEALLEALHRLENRFGRVRERLNAPRPLDLDLIAYGRRVEPGPPILPHPRAVERLFVMGPLAEIAPGWRHPVLGDTAAVLAARTSVGRGAAPLL